MEQNLNKDAQRGKLLDIAHNFHQKGNLPEAETIYHEVLRADFDCADAWHLLGVLAFQVGQHEAAIELIGEAITLDPEDPFYHNDLGNVYKRLGKLGAAVRCYDRALFLKPDYVDAHYNRATALKDQGQLEAATESYLTALRLRPDDHEILNDLGATLRQRGELDAAIECYREAVRLNPAFSEIHINLGLALEHQGNVEAAMDCYRQALRVKPNDGKAYLRLVQLSEFTLKDPEEISRLEALLSGEEITERDSEYLHWALGQVYDSRALFDDAFKHYEAANNLKLKRKNLVFNCKSYANEISQLIATYTGEFFEQRKEVGIETELPVFIIGMPRAGKSLTEELLSRHAKVFGAGELRYFLQLTKELSDHLKTSKPYPECVTLIDRETGHSLAESYIKQLRKLSSDSLRIINTISNYLYLGLVALLFPRARIIHCRRRALDLCLSIYFKSFPLDGHPYAYDLKDIAACYREYARLMQHWYRVIPNRMLEIDYEDMVANEGQTCRKLLEFCGLQWEEDLPSSQESQQSAEGAGYAKLEEPLHDRFVGQWKNYERFIEPLKEALGYPEKSRRPRSSRS